MQVVTAYKSDDGKVYSTEDQAKEADFTYWLGRLQYVKDVGTLSVPRQAGILMNPSGACHNQLKHAIARLYELTK